MAKLSSIIGLFCLIGCIYQIYDMTQFYLQFKVRRDVAYDYAPYIEMPAIDITVPMAIAMNLTKLFAVYPEEMNSLCAQLNASDAGLNYTTEDFQEKCEVSMQKAPIVFSFRLVSFIKVKDIKEFSGDLNEQVNQISFAKFGNYTDLCNSTRYYNGVAIFIRLICLNGTKPLSVHTNHVTLNEGVVAQLTHTFGTHFGIRFSNQTDLPVFEQGKYHIITRESGSFPFSSISFVKTVMSSLEYPYETNCRYYNKAKSIAKCMTEYSLGQPTPYLFKTLTYEWDQHPDHLGFLRKIDQPEDDEITDRDDSEDEDGYSTDLEMQEYYAIINCTEQAAATECEKTHYLVEGENSDQTKSELGLINIEFSRKANLYLSVHPVLPWSEYVIFIGSILGIWFGISIHDRTLSMLTYIVTRFCKIKTQTKRATKQRKTELNENQRPIQRKLQLKSMKKLPTFDGRHNYVRNIRLSKNAK
uniref:Uncharacterized protein n=1 Tax=Tetranychus urticae TaxID=32264 RepID=T1JUF6_TETUR